VLVSECHVAILLFGASESLNVASNHPSSISLRSSAVVCRRIGGDGVSGAAQPR
jgi:hypothetical protein